MTKMRERLKMKKVNDVERCRLCACEETLSSFYNIFEESSSKDIEMKITKLLPVVVMSWDPMPHKICHSCILKLNYFDEFYESCLKAERLLRTLYPTAPDKCLKNFEPVVEVLGSPVLDKNILYYQETCRTFPIEPETPESSPSSNSTKTAARFIINELTSTDYIFTCRKCFRTFTKESSALTHACVRVEDCEELENVNGVEKKCLPPLKIHLFSEKAGFFKCCLCQGQFENKRDLLSHLKLHFMEEKWREKKRRKKRRRNAEGDSLKSNSGKARQNKETAYSRLDKKKTRRTISHSTTVRNCKSPLIKEATGRPRSQHSKEKLKPPKEEIDMTDEGVKKIKKLCAEEGNAGEVNNVLTKRKKTNAVVHMEHTPDKRDEVTVLEVVQKKSPTSFSSCVFCDKIFATTGALVAHQRKHLGCLGMELKDPDQNHLRLTKEACTPSSFHSFHCSTCAMKFTSKKTLLEHEQYHLVHIESML